jgi:hypothetical protein
MYNENHVMWTGNYRGQELRHYFEGTEQNLKNLVRLGYSSAGTCTGDIPNTSHNLLISRREVIDKYLVASGHSSVLWAYI